MEKFNNQTNVVKYLVKEFQLKRKKYLPFNLNLQNIQKFKDELKQKHSLKEIKVLKADLEGVNGQLKLFATFMSSIALTTTIIGLIISNSSARTTQINNRLTSIEEKSLVLKYIPFTNEELRQAKLNILLKSIEDLQRELFTTLLNITGLTIIGVLTLVLGYVYYSRTRKVTVLYDSVSQAYDEKKEDEENKYRVKISK
ncbi:hypothetical protein SK066_00830 [Paenibacillus hunanensis]|uniref:hypothetical protein n=1 Tax=Paenibacillus hunanensis TaxID=539262 RepID=UPI002A6A872D|nr:hypothetical protein [Paenibacillus hunanensis]WPP41539.1 hypothetical protein SK066_00830 [Paenibacillus hunanensis]